MLIIKNQQVVEDSWIHATNDDELGNEHVIVSWEQWTNQRGKLSAVKDLGVRITGDIAIEDIAKDLAHFKLIALQFDRFADGRCYSHARLLRERYKFTGEIRATGDVLRDQIFYLARCGVNAFEVRNDRDAADALKGLNDFTVRYQPAADEPLALYRRRAI